MKLGMIQSKEMFANLPEGWQIKSFSEVVKDTSGGRVKLKKSELLKKGDIPVVDQGKELIGGYTDRIDSRIEVKNPVIIFGDHTRTFKYIDFDFAVGADGTKILDVKSDILPKFIYYYFTTLEIPNTGYNRHYKFLKDIVIPVPPLSVQKKIVETLDKADEIIQKRQEAISKLDDLIQSIFLDMFGDPNKNVRGWKMELLKNVTVKITDGEHGTVARLDSGVKYLMARNINQHNELDLSELSYISEMDHNRIYRRCNPEFGDLLLVCVGATIGKCCLVPKMEEFSLARSVALVKPNKDLIHPDYLLHLFNTQFIQRQLAGGSNMSAQGGLYLGKIQDIRVPLPPIELQLEFTNIIKNLIKTKHIMKEQHISMHNLFQSLLSQYV